MTTIVRRTVPYALGIPGAILSYVGILSGDIVVLCIAGALMVSWAAFELRHPVNRRRTLAAKVNLWGIPVALALLVLSVLIRR